MTTTIPTTPSRGLAFLLALSASAWLGAACGGAGAKETSSTGDLEDVAGRDAGREDGGDSAGGSVTVDGQGVEVLVDAGDDGGPADGQGSGEVGLAEVGPDPELPHEGDIPVAETGQGGDATPDGAGAGEVAEEVQGADVGPADDADDASDVDDVDDASDVDDAGPGDDADDASDVDDAGPGDDAGDAGPGDDASDAGPDLPLIVCGDGVCDPSEDACACPDDCGCGDGTCDHTETWLSCPEDCGSCGDQRCGPDETQADCPEDCGACGDGVCDLLESPTSCPDDCGGCAAADGVCASTSCDPWLQGFATSATGEAYPVPCGAAGENLVFDLTTLGPARRLVARASTADFWPVDTALTAYTDLTALCQGDATPAACDDSVDSSAGSLLTLTDVPQTRVRLVAQAQPSSDQEVLVTATAYYAPGEPCRPGPSMAGCFAGVCVAACDGAETGRCPTLKDCPDGVDTDGDGLTDEDACASPPVITACPAVVDATAGVAKALGVVALDAGQLAPSFPWVELRSAPPGSSGDVLPSNPAFGAQIKPDVDGLYVVRTTFSNTEGEQTACETTVNVGDYDCADGLDNDGDGFTDEQAAQCGPWSGVLCPEDTIAVGLGDVPLSAAGFGGLADQPITWSVVSAPAGAAPQVADAGAGSGTFTPDRPGLYTLRAEGVLPGTVNHFGCETRVLVALYDCPDGIDADRDGATDEDAAQCTGAQSVSCSPDATIPVLQTATTDTHTSAEVGAALGALWSLEEGPPTWYEVPSTPQGATQACDAGGCTQPAALELLMAGVYRVRYMTVDEAGHAVGCEQTLTTSIPDGLRVELTWNPDVPVPMDTSDVDLHLRHPTGASWFDDVDELDCYYSTCIETYPDWGADGDPTNDPRLDVDDTEGHGPENINIQTPEVGAVYRLGVHLFDADHTPLSTSRVRIFCGGALTAELGPVTLPQANPGTSSDDLMFWEVATIVFDAAGGCAVTPLGGLLTDAEAGH